MAGLILHWKYPIINLILLKYHFSIKKHIIFFLIHSNNGWFLSISRAFINFWSFFCRKHFYSKAFINKKCSNNIHEIFENFFMKFMRFFWNNLRNKRNIPKNYSIIFLCIIIKGKFCYIYNFSGNLIKICW